MSKEWYGDEDKCGECAYNHYDKKENVGYVEIRRVKIMGL